MNMDKLQKTYEDKLQPVFPYLSREEEKPVQTFSYACAAPAKASAKNRETPCADSRIPRNQL